VWRGVRAGAAARARPRRSGCARKGGPAVSARSPRSPTGAADGRQGPALRPHAGISMPRHAAYANGWWKTSSARSSSRTSISKRARVRPSATATSTRWRARASGARRRSGRRTGDRTHEGVPTWADRVTDSMLLLATPGVVAQSERRGRFDPAYAGGTPACMASSAPSRAGLTPCGMSGFLYGLEGVPRNSYTCRSGTGCGLPELAARGGRVSHVVALQKPVGGLDWPRVRVGDVMHPVGARGIGRGLPDARTALPIGRAVRRIKTSLQGQPSQQLGVSPGLS
jgi:hypothetical protein